MLRVILCCGLLWGMVDALSAASSGASVRVVSLSPAITALFYEIGAGDCLVGVTRYCRLPSDIGNPPERVGGALDPDLEKILACRPDRVLAGTLLPSRTVEQMKRLGLEVDLWRQDRLGDIFDQTKRVGELTGFEAVAERRVGDLRDLLDAGKDEGDPETGDGATHPTALMVFSSDIQTVAGPGTYGQEVLDQAGMANAAASLKLKWPSVSREWVLAADPDWMIAATHRPASEANDYREACLDRWRQDPVLSRLEAVRLGRVVVVPDNRLGIPSLRLLEVIPFLREAVGDSGSREGDRL